MRWADHHHSHDHARPPTRDVPQMTIDEALTRIAKIQQMFAAPAPAPSAVGTTTFSSVLSAVGGGPVANAASAVAPLQPLPAGGGGAALLAAAQGEVGQSEQPPGSNDSARIAVYRRATAGSAVGPWCAYFTSWAARTAGVPLGDNGQGFGSVDALQAWAQRSGRSVPAAAGVQPNPGDLIVFHEHIGVVESVLPDGSIQTIEGNSGDQVARRVHPPGDALSYVRMS